MASYLWDIVFFSYSLKRPIGNVRIVLGLLKQAVLALSMKRCALFTYKIYYLGHVIRPGRLQIASHTTDSKFG